MKMSRVNAIANAVLYEGYMLYPYRPSAIKNQQRFNFGVVAPETKAKSPMSSELSCITTECLLQGTEDSAIDIEVRFLQLVQRDVEVPSLGGSRSASVGGGEFRRVERCEVDGRFLSSWQEAIERRIGVGPFAISALLEKPARKDFVFDAVRETEPIYDQNGTLAARFVRHREKLSGNVDLAVIRLDADLFKLSATIVNTSPFCETGDSNHESANVSSFLSTHKVLRCAGAEFVSLTDPPERLREHASGCKNSGTWPILAAEDSGNADVLLSSPIILYDYPEIAPESAGELFDGTEIDEILALRILTMTDEEKREMRSVDDRTRAILERTELLPPEHFMKLHGAMRALAPAGKERSWNEFEWRLLEDRAPADSVLIAGVEVKLGDSVKLRPKSGGDIMDLALAGKIARVAAIEQDYEGKLQLAVVVDADPGKDLGMLRQPGHQFFFEPDEVEPYTPAELSADTEPSHAKLLVAGIGNIFLGDDGFGVEVIKRLQGRVFPPAVKVVDFGIRGFDLAYALLENYETAILIDACARGEAPGTLYVIEPELDSIAAADSSQPLFDAHGMNPMNVLRLAKSLGPDGLNKRILLLGCEPLTFGPEEGQLGLSDEVSAAVDGAVALLDSLISRILAGENPGIR